MASLPDVETAYAAGPPCPPPVQPNDDPRSANQGYLNAAPGGIDARWAWDFTDGSDVGFVDLERGWTLDHDDLTAAGSPAISASTRIFMATEPRSSARWSLSTIRSAASASPPRPRARRFAVAHEQHYNTAAASFPAGDNMQPGDVLLLEAQTTIGKSTYLPVEVETAAFDAIRQTVDDGIVVIEPPATAPTTWTRSPTPRARRYWTEQRRFQGQRRDHGGCGVVGGAAPAAQFFQLREPHRLLCLGQEYRHPGRRLDRQCYQQLYDRFRRDVRASPIVTGAALLLQSWFKWVDGEPALPEDYGPSSAMTRRTRRAQTRPTTSSA